MAILCENCCKPLKFEWGIKDGDCCSEKCGKELEKECERQEAKELKELKKLNERRLKEWKEQLNN